MADTSGRNVALVDRDREPQFAAETTDNTSLPHVQIAVMMILPVNRY